jgi:hypothetical protein
LISTFLHNSSKTSCKNSASSAIKQSTLYQSDTFLKSFH